mmetsp:Transcript_29596/g.75105  ORF Transcript_29596/g.75105 Transcript_29596/m.75105 type:complete len:228 (-) Transcript_29596:166-849(-)
MPPPPPRASRSPTPPGRPPPRPRPATARGVVEGVDSQRRKGTCGIRAPEDGVNPSTAACRCRVGGGTSPRRSHKRRSSRPTSPSRMPSCDLSMETSRWCCCSTAASRSRSPVTSWRCTSASARAASKSSAKLARPAETTANCSRSWSTKRCVARSRSSASPVCAWAAPKAAAAAREKSPAPETPEPPKEELLGEGTPSWASKRSRRPRASPLTSSLARSRARSSEMS